MGRQYLFASSLELVERLAVGAGTNFSVPAAPEPTEKPPIGV